MKIKTFHLSLALFLLCAFTSCNNSDDTAESSKSYPVSAFSSINLDLIGDVYYEQADSFYLNVSGSTRLLNALKVANKKDQLSLSLKNKNRFSNNRKGLVIHVGSPSLASISFDGIGAFNIDHLFKSDQLTIEHNGIGKINIADCQVGTFNLNSKAMGAIVVKGEAQETNIQSHGVGQIDCAGLKSQFTKVSSSGVGNISVYAQNSIDISMSGVGNVKYYGNPANVKSDISGLGKVTNMGR